MRIAALVIVVILFAIFGFAQAPPAAFPAACGPEKVSFKVTRDDSQHSLAQPDPGKARVYFIHDAGTGGTLGYPTVKVAMDGAWVGANHGESYFSVSAEPGEHHVCVTLQSSLVGQRVGLVHFTAEADKIYYYRTQLLVTGRGSIELLELDPIDSDQGKYLIGSFPLSVSSPKK
ncbi:MAG: hypothetical protein WAU58_16305 [Terriglobales bacterium]